MKRKHVNTELNWTLWKFMCSTVASKGKFKTASFSICDNHRVFSLNLRDYRANVHIYKMTLADSSEMYLLLWHVGFNFTVMKLCSGEVLDLHLKHRHWLLTLETECTCEGEKKTRLKYSTDEALISQNWSDGCRKKRRFGINIIFQSASALPLWQRWGTVCPSTPASQQQLVNHQSSSDSRRPWKRKKRPDGEKREAYSHYKGPNRDTSVPLLHTLHLLCLTPAFN